MKIIREDNTDNIFPYFTYIPERISSSPALLIQLHGAGERGNGKEELDIALRYGFSHIINDENFTDCIFVAPQCTKDTFWGARVESLKVLIDNVIEKYSIDTSRIYLCGISMGAFGTWFTAMAYPDMFAAIMPCCGGGMPWNAKVLKMPVWTFHGLKDTLVSPTQTTDMVDALKKTNPNVICELYENVGHNAWDYAFREETLAWLLAQKKPQDTKIS